MGMFMKELFDSMPVLNSDRISIKKIEEKDLDLLNKMATNKNVYKYVPTFIPEKQNDKDREYFIKTMCNNLFNKKDEIVLGVYLKEPKDKFCGIAELYHYDKDKNQVSIGGRFDEEYWNKGIASEALLMAINYLFKETNITRICASNMVDNPASGRVLEKNGFKIIAENVKEDWGFNKKVIVNKWCLEKEKVK